MSKPRKDLLPFQLVFCRKFYIISLQLATCIKIKTVFFPWFEKESCSEEAMSHSWVLGFHHRGHKGILPLEIASDLQQDKLHVSCPIYL